MRETPAARIERLLDAGDNTGAWAVATELIQQSPGSFFGNFGRARASMRLANYVDAETYCNEALRIMPNQEAARLLRASLDLRLGRTDQALDHFRFVRDRRGSQHVEATVSLLLALHGAGRFEEYQREAAKPGEWRKDPRAEFLLARAMVLRDPEAGLLQLLAVFRTKHHWSLRRYAGFDAVGLLDKARRYREAYDLALEIHEATTAPLDLEPWFGLLDMQLQLLEKKPAHFRPRTPPVEGVAFIAAMPRSGTTLLEQMLDRHPDISGIGEFDGLDHVCRTLFGGGKWPRFLSAVSDEELTDLQRLYLAGAAQVSRPGARWTFDKTLRGWRALPEIATVFPGAVCINVERDPRDMATSIFLSYFNPTTYEWTRDFNCIRRMAEYERAVVGRAFEVLNIPSVRIVYEDLVEDPAHYAAECLGRMGLSMDERVLAPEQNTKAANTLSQAQVRQPINKKSIGRWKNYEWAFDSRWDEVCAAHEARRKHR